MTIAVEIHGASENFWNLLPDSRDLTTWTAGTDNTTVTYDQVGLSGLPNTASLVTDAATSPSQFAFVRSPVVQVNTETIIAVRAWFLKDATSSPEPGVRIYNNWNNDILVGYSIDTSTGAVLLDPSSTTPAAYGGFATERTLGGQSWWELWLWTGPDLDTYSTRVHVYPALRSGATAERSTTVGGVELYTGGTITTSPVTGAWTTLNGTPPNNGSVYLASESHTTGRAGTWRYDILPSLYPNDFYKSRPTDTHFADRLVGDLRYSVKVTAPQWSGRTSTSIGSIEIANDDGALDAWPEYDWRDRVVRIAEFDLDDGEFAYEASRTVLRAIVERMEVVDESTMRIVLRDPVPELYEPFAATYASGATTDADYRVQPITFGNPKQVAPVLVDAATFSYEMHDGSLNAVDEVYIDGVAQSTVSPTFSASGAGFTLPAEASGRVTADPESTATADLDALCTSITSRKAVTFDSITRAQFNALNHSSPETTYKYGYYIESDITAADILNWTASSFNGWWYVNRAGEVVFGRLTDPGTLLENVLINAPCDCKDLSTWALTNITATPFWPGLDGFTPVSGVQGYHPTEATTLIDVETTSAAYASSPTFCIDSATSVVLRFWIKLDTTSSPDPEFRIFDTAGATVLRLTVDTSAPSISVVTGSAQAQARVIGGESWFEVVAQGTPTGNDAYFRIYPAGTTASDTRSITIAGVEVYDGAVIADVLGTPGNMTTSRIIDDVQILGDIKVTPDNAPNLSDGMGANKNWQRSRSGESGSAQTFDREYQNEYRTTTPMLAAYSHAIDANMQMSLLTDSGAAQAEADRMAALYQTQRNFYRVDIAMNSGRFDDYIDSIGQTYRIDSDRLPAAKDLMLVGVSGGWLSNELELTFWG